MKPPLPRALIVLPRRQPSGSGRDRQHDRQLHLQSRLQRRATRRGHPLDSRQEPDVLGRSDVDSPRPENVGQLDLHCNCAETGRALRVQGPRYVPARASCTAQFLTTAIREGGYLADSSAAKKKGRRDWAAQVLGGTRPEAKRLLNPSDPQNDKRLFRGVFTQKGKWLRDRFFGTGAVKSVHGFERCCGYWSLEARQCAAVAVCPTASSPTRARRPHSE